jgi:hypothetical protein
MVAAVKEIFSSIGSVWLTAKPRFGLERPVLGNNLLLNLRVALRAKSEAVSERFEASCLSIHSTLDLVYAENNPFSAGEA